MASIFLERKTFFHLRVIDRRPVQGKFCDKNGYETLGRSFGRSDGLSVTEVASGGGPHSARRRPTQDDALFRFIIMADVDIVLAGPSIDEKTGPVDRSTPTRTNSKQLTVTNHTSLQCRSRATFADIWNWRHPGRGRMGEVKFR